MIIKLKSASIYIERPPLVDIDLIPECRWLYASLHCFDDIKDEEFDNGWRMYISENDFNSHLKELQDKGYIRIGYDENGKMDKIALI